MLSKLVPSGKPGNETRRLVLVPSHITWNIADLQLYYSTLHTKMHGRLKVRSSAEVEEAKRREKEAKVRTYREITARIYAKRSEGDLDDEALQLIGKVVSDNPDIASLWNYRREVLEDRLPSLSPEEGTRLCATELSLSENCLRVNPKSYCAWLHRQWVMEHSPSPDWKDEKALCDLFLKYDERNFHCWDYRRFVIAKAGGISPQEEFEFTYDKIAANFSNYSAWHYRSKLLPKLYPSSSTEGGVTEDALLKEYELVQNAFFTDPSDQSAWFYHRWLLGKVDKPLTFSCVLFRRNPKPTICVVFNQPIKFTTSRPIRITVGESPVDQHLQSDWPMSLWVCPIPDDVMDDEVTVKVQYDTQEAKLTIRKGELECWWVGDVEGTFHSVLTAAASSVLSSELESCQELLQLEPENKWCLLTTVLLMQALGADRHHDKITELFRKLLTVDQYRQGYYRDLLSKFQIEQTLAAVLQNFSDSSRVLDLSGKDLSRLYYTEHMLLFQEVLLSGNQLTTLHGMEHLKTVRTLVLDGNQLESLPKEMESLSELRILSLENNNIGELEGVECLRGLQQLEAVNLEGNPVCELAEFRTHLLEILPHLRELNGRQLEQGIA